MSNPAFPAVGVVEPPTDAAPGADPPTRPDATAGSSPRARTRAWWRATRFWLGLVAVVLLAAVVVSVENNHPAGRPLDPTSASPDGSQALMRLLAARGTHVERSTNLTQVSAGSTVLVTDAAVYSDERMRVLAAGHRLILVEPDPSLLGALDPTLAGTEDDTAKLVSGDVSPRCSEEAAVAAGVVHFSDSALHFATSQCYDGRVLITPRLVALADYTGLTNEFLADRGVAALDINLISDNGRVADVTWVMSDVDASAESGGSIWDLFPDWTPRALAWLSALGLLTALWRGRRLAPVVLEPLPVVVRGSEVVRGHARLYRRAAAREQAALALRRASSDRLARRMGLRIRTSEQVLIATFPTAPARELTELLGPIPLNDLELVRLGQRLSALEAEQSLIDHPTLTAEGKTP